MPRRLGPAAALLLALAAPAAAQTATVPSSREQIQLSFAPLVQKAAPAVVNIYTKKVVRQRAVNPLFDDPLFRRFFGDTVVPGGGPTRQRVQNSLGSGVIVRPDGLVVTNHHVIEGADEITVVLHDRREYEAEVVRSDQRTDLAVLRIKAPGALPALTLRNSDDLQVGDLVVAIGNPFGVGQTVTSGIVSALARTNVGIGDFSFFIQTDAAINPGNSGGALIAMDGSLVGINTAIYSRSGGSIGIGFAIPAEMVRTVVEGVEGGGPVLRPWLGASTQAVDGPLAASLGLDRPAGVLLRGIHPAGPAAKAGLKIGDVVVAVNGREVDEPEALRYRIATQTLGSSAKLDVLRDGRRQSVALPVTLPPETPPRDKTLVEGRSPLAGATIANLSPALAEEMALGDSTATGVVVLSAVPGSPAGRLGLKPGDILLRLNDQPIDSVAGLKQAAGRAAGAWLLSIRRGDEVINARIAR
ncbi:MAG TPA: DegQ family serine endoprotease [Alphaproteobacteria bacterium]|nr:DegQ family serine endoprotease [Alphaproteobacteria bacterium]